MLDYGEIFIEVTKMAGNIKTIQAIVPKQQGVTGREENRMVGDECPRATTQTRRD